MALFSKTACGLDIADHTIECVELEKGLFAARPRVQKFGRMALEHGIVEKGRLVQSKKLAHTLQELWDSMSPTSIHPKNLYVGLPERLVYTSVVTLDHKEHPELASGVHKVATTTIPLESDDLLYQWRELLRTESATDVLLYGTSKEVLHEWQTFFEGLDIAVKAFDHELLAIMRGLRGAAFKKPVCIVDIGAERTKVALSTARGLEYVYSFEVAGDSFTAELAKANNITEEEAEKYKIEHGMTDARDVKLFQSLLAPLSKEIQTACAVFKTKRNEEIVEIILVGGSSQLKGLPEYLGEQLKIPVSRGSSFLVSSPQAGDQTQLHYIEAIGLALKGIDPSWEKREPSF